MRQKIVSRGRVLLLFSLWLTSGTLHADDISNLDWGFRAEHSDNVTLSEEENSESIATLFANLSLDKEGNYYLLSADYQSEISDYLSGTFERRQTTNGRGRVSVHTALERLTFFIENQERDTLINILAADTPENSSQRSRYSTGVQYQWRASKRDTFFAVNSYSINDIKQSEADSSSREISLTYLHRLNNKTSFSMRGNYLKIFPEQFSLDEYLQKRATLSLSRQIRIGEIRFSYGYSEIDDLRTFAQSSIESPEWSIDSVAQSDWGKFNVEFSRKIQDSGAGASIESVLPPDLGSVNFSIEKQDKTSFIYTLPLQISPNSISFEFTYLRSQDLLSELDRKLRSYTVNWQRRLARNRSISARASSFVAVNKPLLINGVLQEDNQATQRYLEISYSMRLFKNTSVFCQVANEWRKNQGDSSVSAGQIAFGFNSAIW